MKNLDRGKQAGEFGPLALRFRWVGFLLLGLVLLFCGIAAVSVPTMSTIATSTVLGIALAIAGAVTVIQTFQVKGWAGFAWQLLCGAAEIVGGLLIWLNPMKGAAAVTLLVAIVVLAQGFSLLGLSLRVRREQGWGWLCAASLISIAISVALVFRFPFTSVTTPGAMAGIALAVAGLAYIAMAVGLLKVRSDMVG
ncbi:HdeD family acid-resistance protein [Microvirga antarctica]|uniref:HdeD family acid-resistance protein n=1 Tax=Microvirga antarctica TaxID=2819233 RepID=UPI001B30DA93|nr:HdeD family acid-resistance protein [Microvirga antarctica]